MDTKNINPDHFTALLLTFELSLCFLHADQFGCYPTFLFK